MTLALRAAFALALSLGACAPRAPASDTTSARVSPESGSTKQARADRARRACEAPTDCVLMPRTCCGRCGAATPDDAVALSARWLEAQREAGAITCEGGDEGCPDCFAETASTLVATCRAGRCAVVDLTRSPVTACRGDADCALTLQGCCDCGSPGPIAVRRGRESAYRQLICGVGPTACPACVGPPLIGTATCVAGHCVVAPPSP